MGRWRAVTMGLALAAVAVLGVQPARAAGFPANRRPIPAPTVYLIAWNAPTWMRVPGPGRYLCPATAAGTRAQIQAAIDAVYAAGGGTIVASPGLFTVPKPSDAVDVVFVADVVDGSGSATLLDNSTSLDVTTGTFANIAVGQIYRASGGQDDADDSVEDNALDICFTIELKTGVSSVTVATWDDSENLLTEAGAFANAEVADWLYVSGGTNVTVGWHQITTVVDADNVTIVDTEIDDGAGDLAGGDIESSEALLSGEDFLTDYGSIAGGSGGQPTFVRMIGAIQLKPGVFLQGAGMGSTSGSTEIKLADDSNCTMVTCEPPTQFNYGELSAGHGGVGISNLTLNGNRTNQGDGSEKKFHPLCNGILLSDHIMDVQFKQIAVMEMKGDCWHINQPWGCVIDNGGWTRYSNGSGFVFGDGNDGMILGHKIYAVGQGTDRDAHASNTCPGDTTTFSQVGIRLHWANRFLLMPHVCGSVRGWSIRILGNNTRVLGVALITDDTNADGCIFVGGGLKGIIISDCDFCVQVAGTTGIRLQSAPEFTITGNWFDTRCDLPIDITTGSYNHGMIEGNVNAFVGDSGQSITNVRALMRSERAKNTSGSNILLRTFCRRKAGSGTIQIVSGVTTAIDPLGMVLAQINDGNTGAVQTCGYQWKGPLDDAAGANNAAVAVGDELCCSDQTDGSLEEAESTHWVVAIAEKANNGALDGGINYVPIYILPRAERYIKP